MPDIVKYHGEVFGDIGPETFVIESSEGYGQIVTLTVTLGGNSIVLHLQPEQASELGRHLTAAAGSF